MSTVPSDASCLRVVASGSRSSTKLFGLMPGTSPTFSLDRLVQFDMTGTKMDDPARRTAEQAARTAANLDWLDRSFAEAGRDAAEAVVITMQADMWDGMPLNGFDSTVQKIASASIAFGKPVLLIEGDSHVFKVDNPLAMGDPLHALTTPVPSLTRVVVQGSTTAPLSEWVRLHVDPAATPPFSWTRNPR